MSKLKTQLFAQLPSNDIFLKSLASFCVLASIAIVIWFFGPNLLWSNHYPFRSIEKRTYIILSLFLLWLLKLLLVDLESPAQFQLKNPIIRQKLQQIRTRFNGALQFLKKTTITRGDSIIYLNQLPWYLLLGPASAGKTTLLANSNINYILQRHFHNQNIEQLQASDNCDWWVTKDVSIVDVPSRYLSSHELIKIQDKKSIPHSLLWQFFLSLIKRNRGKHGIQGIIITLPLPELMKNDDNKKYHLVLRELFHRIHELHAFFPQNMPCYLLITKCDLLSGFVEFFAESGNDEIGQAWGIALPKDNHKEFIYDAFAERFNSLIKKLNQQLLWRLHQERNPMARPYIKDFPLQIERLKEFALDFIKRFANANLGLSLQGVYLMSARQENTEDESSIVEEPTNSAHRSIQIFKPPIPASRPYFIKQFILQGLVIQQPIFKIAVTGYVWIQRMTIAASLAIIAYTAYFLGKDFEQGVNRAYSIQNYLSEYQLAIQKNQDPEEHLIQATNLLDTLQSVAQTSNFKLDFSSIRNFYSHKAQLKANVVYQQALKTIFLSAIQNYLEEFLKNPVNKNAESIYAVLKAYLMLSSNQYFEPNYIIDTVQQILPRSIESAKSEHLLQHLSLALNSNWQPIRLNMNVIHQTRHYLAAIPSFQLGYIILKTLNHNNVENEINLGITRDQNTVFVNRQMTNQIPEMFTARSFVNILTQETVIAAQEATIGNWVLGENLSQDNSPETAATLIEQLRIAYVNNYIDVWEALVANIQLVPAKDIYQLDAMLVKLTRNDSPLLQLLQTLHENTYFEPIASSSPKLQSLGFLLDKNRDAENQLYQIFASLQGMHQYIQAILTSSNEKKAAFEAVSHRMLDPEKPDALAQLRYIASKSPEPLRNWMDKIANDAWHFLMQDAANYIDTSWRNQVNHIYQVEIQNRYPFSSDIKKDVDLKKFTKFFGKPGTLINFYHHYLQHFVDMDSPDWRWKTLENEKLPFSDTTLRQLQQAMLIHHTFFPNGDDKMYVQFALQPYKFDKKIKSVRLNINDKQIIDKQIIDPKTNLTNPHIFAWPAGDQLRKTSIQLTLDDKKTIKKDFPGEWGWFKLISQSFESAVTKKEILINLSMSEQPVRYLLSTEGQANPFLSLNLRQFTLPPTLLESEK